MSKIETGDNSENIERNILIGFICPNNDPKCYKVVFATGINAKEARAKITAPKCEHGEMHSAPNTMK